MVSRQFLQALLRRRPNATLRLALLLNLSSSRLSRSLLLIVLTSKRSKIYHTRFGMSTNALPIKRKKKPPNQSSAVEFYFCGIAHCQYSLPVTNQSILVLKTLDKAIKFLKGGSLRPVSYVAILCWLIPTLAASSA